MTGTRGVAPTIGVGDLNTTQLAKVWRKTPNTLRAWTKEGMPRAANGLYNLADCLAWWEARTHEKATAVTPPSDEAEARARKLSAEAELAEYKVAEVRGQMVTTEDAGKEIEGRVGQMRAEIISVPGRWAPEVVGLATAREAQARLDDLVRDLLARVTADDADQ